MTLQSAIEKRFRSDRESAEQRSGQSAAAPEKTFDELQAETLAMADAIEKEKA